MMPRVSKTLLLSCVALLFAGCASLPERGDLTPTFKYQHPEETALGRLFGEPASEHPGESGFLLLREGKDAFLARAALCEMAEHTIDLQYFIWTGDASGRVLLDRVVHAADRGVRVRILIDDLSASRRYQNIAAVETHPNVEVRIFNPFGKRDLPWALRGIQMLTNISRLNRRMHNKIFAVDNQVAIVGGRNIGDVYFGVDPTYHFRDLDVLAAGPIVGHLSESFDRYWNSAWAIPITAFDMDLPSGEEAAVAFERLHDFVAGLTDFPYPVPEGKEQLLAKLRGFLASFVWARARVTFDSPEKVAGDTAEGVVHDLRELARSAKRDILISSPYFVPMAESLDRAEEYRSRGVSVRVLTNSLASTNHAIVHSGYARYRKRMLRRGVLLYEVRPDAESRNRDTADPALEHSLVLHTKAVVFDREVAYVGSFNLGPRSAFLNTEVGLIIYSPEIASQVAEAIEAEMRPENSWRVLLNRKEEAPSPEAAESDLVWITERNGEEQKTYFDPGASFWRRVVVLFGTMLPIESQF
jgi:putative cardiolipin synthase